MILVRGPHSSRDRIFYVAGPPFPERKLFWSFDGRWSVGRYEFAGFVKNTQRTVAYRCLRWRHFTRHENDYYRNTWPKPGLEPSDGLQHQVDERGIEYALSVLPNDPWKESYWVRRGLPVPAFVYSKGKRRTALILKGARDREYVRSTPGAAETRKAWMAQRWMPGDHGLRARDTGRESADDAERGGPGSR